MKKTLTILTACVLAVSFVTPTMAADEKKKKARTAVKVPKSIELTADQKTKLDALNKEFGPKLAECKAKAAASSPRTRRKPVQKR